MPETVVHFQIRMPPSLHEHLSSRARLEKSSLNALIVSILQREEERSGREVTDDPPGAPSSR